MRELTIDEKSYSSIRDVHEALATGLGFPAHYGRNLSALWDCLGDLDEPVRIVMRPASGEAFIDEVDSVLRVLARAAHHGMIDLVVASTDDWGDEAGDADTVAQGANDAGPVDAAEADEGDFDDFSDVSD